MMEHPWTSAAWGIKCLEDFLASNPFHEETNEPVEVVKIDQCQYGLRDVQNGLPHKKSTGLMLSSHFMKKRLNKQCDGSHEHQQLEGSNRTRLAQQLPEELCHAILSGAYEELLYGTLHQAFPVEEVFERHEEMGGMDGIHSEQDLAPLVKKRRIDEPELQREEMLLEQSAHETKEDRLVMEQEEKRRRGWLTLPREKRLAVRRLHTMTGHCSNVALMRMLVASTADKDVIDAVKFFQCQVCKETEKDQHPRVTKETRPSSQMHFNYELSADVFEIHDSEHHRHSILSLVDLATHFHVAVRVAGGGTPSSKACADALNVSWIAWAGAPTFFVADQGVHNRGKVAHLLTVMGTTIRQTGARAPHQLGVGERHGGLLKEIMKRAIHERQIKGAEDIAALCSESARVKNLFINQRGYSPSQWVMGYQPQDITSLNNNDLEQSLGLHQSLLDAEEGAQDSFAKQLLIRQWAKEAFIKLDTSQRVRKAMLRKSIPMRGPYRCGDLVSFSKKGKWYGPARVLAHEGKSSLWLLHSGVAILVAETSCRPATTAEVLKRHALELRPERKRKRQILTDWQEDDELPFADDYIEDINFRGGPGGSSEQVPFVDFQEVNAGQGETGVTAIPGDAEMNEGTTSSTFPSLPQHVEQPHQAPLQSPPGLEMATSMEDGVETPVETMTRVSTMSSQPEAEITPAPSISTHPTSGAAPSNIINEQVTPLTQSLRQSPDRLDGIFRRREPSASDSFLANKTERKYKKKTQKVGAGRELNFSKETPEMQKKLLATREKEWHNWKFYSDGKLVPEEEVVHMIAQNPELKIIPTRWVDVNKSEIGEEEKLKSRLVVRGDLEDSSLMRCDSPTCSQTMISLVLTLAACRDTTLWSGDISAAFLQGSKLDRVLILSLPKDGVPGVAPNMYYIVSSTVYGTKDAPRGWWKNLDSTLKKVCWSLMLTTCYGLEDRSLKI